MLHLPPNAGEIDPKSLMGILEQIEALQDAPPSPDKSTQKMRNTRLNELFHEYNDAAGEIVFKVRK